MADFLGLCLALERLAASQYQNYNFNSMCKFGDVYLGASDDGIFELDSGDTDDGTEIEAFFETVTSDFGIEHQKRFRRAYFGYETDGQLTLIIKDDDENERIFNVTPIHANQQQHTSVVPLPRNAKGRYWVLRVENVRGSDFSVDSIRLIPVVLNRKPSQS
jgi:hypothetical protein